MTQDINQCTKIH